MYSMDVNKHTNLGVPAVLPGDVAAAVVVGPGGLRQRAQQLLVGRPRRGDSAASPSRSAPGLSGGDGADGDAERDDDDREVLERRVPLVQDQHPEDHVGHQ